jgi:hypothetical protein
VASTIVAPARKQSYARSPEPVRTGRMWRKRQERGTPVVASWVIGFYAAGFEALRLGLTPIAASRVAHGGRRRSDGR